MSRTMCIVCGVCVWPSEHPKNCVSGEIVDAVNLSSPRSGSPPSSPMKMLDRRLLEVCPLPRFTKAGALYPSELSHGS